MSNAPEPVGRNDHPDEPTLFWTEGELRWIAERDSQWRRWSAHWGEPHLPFGVDDRAKWFLVGWLGASVFIAGLALLLR